MRTQESIMKLTEIHGPSAILVLLGAPDPESAEITAETLISGDPSYAGPLAGVQLGLDVHHVLEAEVKEAVPQGVWDEEIGVMADVLDVDSITVALATLRDEGVAG